MEVCFSLDNEELATSYDLMSDSQFENGVKLVECLGIKSGDKVLDVGSGTGRLGTYVANIIGPSGRIIGVDPLEERIKIANNKNQYENAVYKIGTAEDLSFIPDNNIDVVYLNAVFHWVNNKEKALKEIFRVLKPKGRLGITTIPRECMAYWDFARVIGNVFKREEYCKFFDNSEKQAQKYILTTTELIEMLQKAGLLVNNIQIEKRGWGLKTAKETLMHMNSSSFGNLLGRFTEDIQEQVNTDIETELERYLSKEGENCKWHGITAIAYKN
jgi:ubiquinone/menaquinone biosynthesis C-methylase UbiE